MNKTRHTIVLTLVVVATVLLSACSTGSATIWVRDQLQANLSSSGDLRYRGDPTMETTTSSTGEVIQIDD